MDLKKWKKISLIIQDAKLQETSFYALDFKQSAIESRKSYKIRLLQPSKIASRQEFGHLTKIIVQGTFNCKHLKRQEMSRMSRMDTKSRLRK